jgi:hypothetical protein
LFGGKTPGASFLLTGFLCSVFDHSPGPKGSALMIQCKNELKSVKRRDKKEISNLSFCDLPFAQAFGMGIPLPLALVILESALFHTICEV